MFVATCCDDVAFADDSKERSSSRSEVGISSPARLRSRLSRKRSFALLIVAFETSPVAAAATTDAVGCCRCCCVMIAGGRRLRLSITGKGTGSTKAFPADIVTNSTIRSSFGRIIALGVQGSLLSAYVYNQVWRKKIRR